MTYSFEELQKLFLQDRRYILNCTERTMGLYDQIFLKWEKYAGGMPDQAKLTQFIVAERQAGLSPVTVNIHIRGFNAFLNWCAAGGYLPPMKMQKLKVEKKVMRVFTDAQLQTLLSFKPKDKYEYRIKAILCTLIDTGMRITECLSIELANVNFDNLLITVMGKGQKQRVVPMSLELRKTLFHFVHRHRITDTPCKYLFCTSNGWMMTYRNIYRDVEWVFKKVGLDKKDIDGFFHSFRRKFARSYIKSGGNLIYLQQAMGHTTLEMTREYIEIEDEELKDMHLRTSLLSRLRS